jgi:hypothetical protein
MRWNVKARGKEGKRERGKGSMRHEGTTATSFGLVGRLGEEAEGFESDR